MMHKTIIIVAWLMLCAALSVTGFDAWKSYTESGEERYLVLVFYFMAIACGVSIMAYNMIKWLNGTD